MIQQQVVTAQQASAGQRSGSLPYSGARDSAADSGSCSGENPGVTSGGGWNSGTGPVRASHAFAVAGPTKDQGAQRGALGQAGASGLEGASFREETPGAAVRSSGTDRVCVPEQSQPLANRAQTPTRYTQSSGLPGALADSGECGRVSARRASLPVGSARQACRSLGQHEQRVDRGRTDTETPTGEDTPDGTKQRQRRHRGDTSIDGLLPDGGTPDSLRAGGSATLAGGTLEDYIIGKQIGQGAYATVCFGLHRETNRKVAVKVYEKYKLLDPQRRKSVRCEIRLMERLRHPNIVVFHDAIDTAKQIYIVMEFVSGGSLHHYLKKRPGRRLDDQVAKRLFFQVNQGLKYLHDRHVVHRDVKLENLLLDEHNTIKIIDFGFSTIVPPGKKLKVFCGTPSYMAPEIVSRKENSGFCADIWATGVLLYALLCGNFPFRGQNDRDLYRKIVRGSFHVPDLVGDGARGMLGRILNADMTRRPSVDSVLADAWLSCHREDLHMPAKGSSNGYHPNSSTSSTATTATPSSAGPSAREPCLSNVETQASVPPAARIAEIKPASGRTGEAWEPSGVEPTAEVPREVAPTALPAPAVLVSEQREALEAELHPSGRSVEAEAIAKLERLGYPRDDIIRQLRDESSHLCKLYHRFLKALTAWDSKK